LFSPEFVLHTLVLVPELDNSGRRWRDQNGTKNGGKAGTNVSHGQWPRGILGLTPLDNTVLGEALVTAVQDGAQTVVSLAEFISALLLCIAAD
jgi:hypothetical protein